LISPWITSKPHEIALKSNPPKFHETSIKIHQNPNRGKKKRALGHAFQLATEKPSVF
jgi:hypothetical protein